MQVEGEGGGGDGMGQLSVQPIGVLYGEMGKCFCLKVIQPFIENIDHNDGSGELIPVFHDPQRNGRPSPLTLALI